MHRRRFIEWATSALGMLALSGCVSGRQGQSFTQQAFTQQEFTQQAGRPEQRRADSFHATRKFAETRFGRIAYVERGAGDAALFLHGFPLNGYQWRDALIQLAPLRRCIAPDFMGLGYTETPYGQSVTAAAQVEMLMALLDTLRIGTVDVVANDSGGAVAQLLVAKHRARVRTLLLTNCDSEIDCPPPALLPVIELSRNGKFADEWLAPWQADKTLARSSQGIGGMCYANPDHPTDEAIDTYFAPLLASATRKAQLHAYAMALEPNVLAGIESALKRCTVPTRILWGEADTIFSPESPAYLSRTFGHSRGVRSIPGSKLFWPEERPDIIAEEARLLWGAR